MAKQSIFDSYIAAAMEYDIFAGGDPSMPASKRFTTETAKQVDQDAAAEKEAIDNGEPPPAPQNQDSEDQQNKESTNMNEDDDFGDDAEDGEDGFGDGGNDTQSDADSNPMSTDAGVNHSDPNSDLDKKRKVILYKMTVALHSAIISHLDAMSNITPPSDEDSSAIYFQIQDHLNSSKDILYRIATNDIAKGEYADVLRRVTAITKVYELSLAAIDKLFPKLDSNDKKTRK